MLPGFADATLVAGLHAVAAARQSAGEFRPARVGRGAGAVDARDVRGDAIRWLEPEDAAPAVRTALASFEGIRAALNRELYLGLAALEAHFAAYPAGARYAVHLDRFRDDDARAVSVVLYLNPTWTPDDGGALRLYLEHAGEPPWRDVAPVGGTLVAFLSERFHHEVLPARRERYSLTGWFMRRR